MVVLHTFEGYKDYVLAYLAENKAFKRKHIAELIQAQTAFVSQVFNGHLHLSAEQAERLSRGMGHTLEERRFFLLLVQYERAGTHELRSFLGEQLEEMRGKFRKISERMGTRDGLKLADQAKYYSSWHYQAIHYLTTIPDCRGLMEISKRLSLEPDVAREALDFLQGCGLVGEESGKYKALTMRIHLPQGSPMNRQNHFNFRMKAMLAMTKEEPQDLHYTSVFTASRADIAKMRERILRLFEELNATIAPSPEEELFNLCVDYYRIK